MPEVRSLCQRARHLDGMAVAIGLFCGAVYLRLSPPLFDLDGYMYRLDGLTPLEQLNQAHLLWIPCQTMLWQLSFLFNASSPRFFQVVGILVLSIVLALSYRLWKEVVGDRWLAAVFTLYVALSPQVWFLGTQNQPYPLLFLFVILYLMRWHTAAPGNPPLVASAVWLGLATLFHQAAVFLFAGAAVLIFITLSGTIHQRLRTTALWLLISGAVVGGIYFGFGRLEGLESLADYRQWLVGYVGDQHTLQGRLYENLARSVVGILKTVVQLESAEYALYDRWTNLQIRHLILACTSILVLGACIGLTLPRIRRSVQAWPWRNPLFLSSLAIGSSWAIFVVIWEPTHYYWVLGLFPFLTMLSLGVQNAGSATRRLMAAGFLLLTGWNLFANGKLDRSNAARFPDPQLAVIRRRITREDLLLFLKKGWEQDVDYDLLQQCLTREGYRVQIFLNDYVVRRPGDWQAYAAAQFKQTISRSGRIFISDTFFQKDLYADLAESSFLSPYVTESYISIDGKTLFMSVDQFFRKEGIKRSDLWIGSDHLWQLGRKRV